MARSTKQAWKASGARQAAAEYRCLIALQQELPQDKQWTMGAAIRAAKARAYVEAEAASACR